MKRLIKLKNLYKLERKYGKYAVSNLPLYVVIVFSISYILNLFLPGVYQALIFSPYHIFYEHEYWRIITWIFTTPGDFSFFTLIMLFCYYNIGVMIERAIGTFMFNIYIFGGLIFSTLGAFISSLIVYLTGDELKLVYGITAGVYMTFYFCISIMMIFGMVYSDSMMLFMFIIPIKASVFAIIDAIWLAYYFISYDSLINRVVIVSCVLNAVLWYLLIHRKLNYRQGMASKLKRKTNFDNIRFSNKEEKVSKVEMINPKGITRHKCAVCGRSEEDDLALEFRFCSKCKGNYEYCSDHLFSHEHVH